MSPGADSATPELNTDLIRGFDRNGPRYTSYPTADRFVDGFGADEYRSWAERRNASGTRRGLSLYVHLPFCSTICFYCACNKVVTRNLSKGAQYLGYLAREIAMQASLFRGDSRVEQMHWGGGTPTFFDSSQLAGLCSLLRDNFALEPEGEYSIEIDPRTIDGAGVRALRAMGFNRMSLGVQDFDPDVQRAVNRIQSESQTVTVMRAARDAGFQSINVDLMYGLPRQTLLTFNRTLARVIAAGPDRIAIYNYAHMPARFKPQRRIRDAELPAPDTRLKLLALAVRRLTEAGYVYIGMDHFAKSGDPLSLAQRQGGLHRNFQGYSTHRDCDLIGLGVTAIGSIGTTYSQNHRELGRYYDAIDRGVLPVARGVELDADDLVRRAVIQALLCGFEVSKDAIESDYLVDFDKYFPSELLELRLLARSGLVQLEDRRITVTPPGRFLIRNLCMVFDKHLRAAQATAQYSRVI